MGVMLSASYNRIVHPDVTPEFNAASKFDPLYGFRDGREEKVMIATQEEMDSLKMPMKYRDYCAHKYIEFQRCRKANFPWVAACEHEKHEYHDCEYAEYIDRMKDYERERRLMERAKRIAKKAEAA
ncbi:NADH dehydrogenase [ubiquinone] 1 beta subcomplex subunit 7 [Macrosteles quadrilineatus]|uniref:NADH dehydrogenase [ubiquinone] 1 beta subcomplex subunit 7 n=1 Tax=Macrosteles quadrilineatus TaxID=74068 RepID=UPI0023E108FA|nr:NADH dehydrogenase [ubiquinone] 1 beta subcomplex subunit 7 [Macrosteles quadrilineatus]